MPWSLPREQALALATILTSFTPDRAEIWYLVWEGYGEHARHLAERSGRRYVVYHGGLGDIKQFYHWNRPPADYWFPENQSWCVASDVDLYWTYVGGTQRCIEAILGCSSLEAVPVDLSQGLLLESDTINQLSFEEMSRWRD